MGSKSRPPCFLTAAISSSGSRTNRSSPKIPTNMFPFTKPDSWPNIGFSVTAGSSGTMRASAAFASSLGLGIFIPLGAAILANFPPFHPPHGDVMRFFQKWLDRLKGRLAGIEDAHKVVGAIHRVRHQSIERREVVAAAVSGEQLRVGLLADADVQGKDAWAVQVRRIVEIAVVLGHDGRERKPVGFVEI